MNEIISGTYADYRLKVGKGKIWFEKGMNEVQINKETIEKHEVVDSTSTTTSQNTTTTQGKSRKGTKSMAGRALVGGALFGPVGAIVGAGTAKNKSQSVSKGVTTKTTTREFKILVTFKDGKEALLHLDEQGYENFLGAVFSDPYETLQEIRENSKKTLIRLLKFVVCPIIYLILLVKLPIPILLLTLVGAGWLIYKRINKSTNKKNKKDNSTSL